MGRNEYHCTLSTMLIALSPSASCGSDAMPKATPSIVEITLHMLGIVVLSPRKYVHRAITQGLSCVIDLDE